MGFALRQGVSFCEVSDRLLFLDIVADRYFCLQPRVEHAFRMLMRDKVLNEGQRCDLSSMLHTGTLLEAAGHDVPHAFRHHPQALHSLLDTQGSPATVPGLAGALTAVLSARLSLRWRRFHQILRSVELGRISWPRTGTVDLDALQDAATALKDIPDLAFT
jgi:hypothetical protein